MSKAVEVGVDSTDGDRQRPVGAEPGIDLGDPQWLLDAVDLVSRHAMAALLQDPPDEDAFDAAFHLPTVCTVPSRGLDKPVYCNLIAAWALVSCLLRQQPLVLPTPGEATQFHLDRLLDAARRADEQGLTAVVGDIWDVLSTDDAWVLTGQLAFGCADAVRFCHGQDRLDAADGLLLAFLPPDLPACHGLGYAVAMTGADHIDDARHALAVITSRSGFEPLPVVEALLHAVNAVTAAGPGGDLAPLDDPRLPATIAPGITGRPVDAGTIAQLRAWPAEARLHAGPALRLDPSQALDAVWYLTVTAGVQLRVTDGWDHARNGATP
ncbi:hypothetical protein AB0M46_21455 [Dactylosporangium sp. NPDC051485]|uniref:hypothetical protein n=1 Tax=Dactylosporangium sp. NPDC051485 TaxID=3154846 RepID=UPI00344121E2